MNDHQATTGEWEYISKSDVESVIKILDIQYPDAKCSLIYNEPYQLLIAARLSSQCADKRVNEVTNILFSEYRNLESFAVAKIGDIEDIIRPCGLFHTKAASIVYMCRDIIQKFNGELPSTIEDLTSLPGIGRKTANLILGDIYHKTAIICDTHCIRITNLLGWSQSKDPIKVEKQLSKTLPPEKSTHFCHLTVYHGRKICKARNPQCNICPIIKYCKYGQSQR